MKIIISKKLISQGFDQDMLKQAAAADFLKKKLQNIGGAAAIGGAALLGLNANADQAKNVTEAPKTTQVATQNAQVNDFDKVQVGNRFTLLDSYGNEKKVIYQVVSKNENQLVCKQVNLATNEISKGVATFDPKTQSMVRKQAPSISFNKVDFSGDNPKLKIATFFATSQTSAIKIKQWASQVQQQKSQINNANSKVKAKQDFNKYKNNKQKQRIEEKKRFQKDNNKYLGH